MTEVRKEKIDGKFYVISLNRAGLFEAEVDGETITADTLNDIRSDLRKAVRKANASNPFPITLLTLVYEGGRSGFREGERVTVFRDGDVVGLHARGGKPLVKWLDDNSRQAVDSYGVTFLRRLTPEQKADLRVIFDAKQAAEQAWNKALDSFKVRVDQELEARNKQDQAESEGIDTE